MGETLQSVGFVNFAGRPASSPSFSTLTREIYPRNHRAASSIPPFSLAWALAQLFPAPGCKAHQVGTWRPF